MAGNYHHNHRVTKFQSIKKKIKLMLGRSKKKKKLAENKVLRFSAHRKTLFLG